MGTTSRCCCSWPSACSCPLAGWRAGGLAGLVLVIGAGLHDPLLWGLLAFFMLLGRGLPPVMAVRLRCRAIPYLAITPDRFRRPGLIEASVP